MSKYEIKLRQSSESHRSHTVCGKSRDAVREGISEEVIILKKMRLRNTLG